MKMLKNHKSKIIIITIFFSVGFIIGRSSKNNKVIEKEKIVKEIQYIEKYIATNQTNKNQTEKIIEKITINIDGSKSISREILKINKDEISSTQKKFSNSKTKTKTTKSKITINKNLNLSLYLNVTKITDLQTPSYGVLIQKDMIGDINLGIGVNSNKSFLLSIGYRF